MSLVTNCILSFSISETEKERIEEVNSFFDCKPFISCADESLPNGWYGGTKYLETPIYIGAFNYFNKVDFINHLVNIEWYYPEDVQLIIEEQDDARFRIIELPPIHLSSVHLKEYYDLLRKPRI